MVDDTVGVIATGASADVIVVDGDPSLDVTVLQDRSRIRNVWCRGEAVDLSRPWPQRKGLPGESVGMWSAQPLTWELVHP